MDCQVRAKPSNFKNAFFIGFPSGNACVIKNENGLHKSKEFNVTKDEAKDVTEGSLRKLVSCINFCL